MIERKIIISLITSTAFCEKIKDIYNISLFESATAKLIANWCWEHFTKYKTAPGKEIETIFYTKLKETNISKDIAEEIEDEILPGLSEEYTNEELNLEYILEETEKYFTQRHLTIYKDNIDALLSRGDVEEALKIQREYKPLNTTNKLDNYILSTEEIEKQNKVYPKTLMYPWLKESQLTIIYGNYGSGKSLLAIAVAYLLGLHKYEEDECEVGEWYVKHPTGCLYIDGELGEHEMYDRVKQFEWLGRQYTKRKIQILSVPDYQLKTEDLFYLSHRKNQQQIIRWLKDNLTYKLIVLDSASTLFGLENENDNSEWSNKINPFLRDLRALDIACILLHHSGKDGKRGLRGASSMGAMAHNIFRITSHEKKNVDKGEAWFVLSKDKQRAGGYGFKTFALKFTQNQDKTETHWEITKDY